MIAGADVFIDTEALAHDALAALGGGRHQRLHAPLLVQHAFRRGDDDLRPLFLRRQRLAQGVAHVRDVVGAVDLAHPFGADALHRLDDRMLGRTRTVVGARGGDVLAAGRGGIIIVDHDDHAVVLVEDGVADAAGQPVMPEAAIAHDRDRALARRNVEGGGRRRAQPVAHGGGADIERRQDREQMAADIGGDMVRAELLLHQLHRGKDRPLRAAGAKTRRPRRHHVGQRADPVIDLDAVDVRRARGIRQRIRAPAADEGADRRAHHLRGVFAGHRQQVLAVQLGRNVGVAQDLVQRLLDEFGLAFLDHQHRLLARQKSITSRSTIG